MVGGVLGSSAPGTTLRGEALTSSCCSSALGRGLPQEREPPVDGMCHDNVS